MPQNIEIVDRPERLGSALADVDEPVVGVDVERADADRYFREASLVQVGVAGTCLLVDPHALDDLTELDAFLSGRLAVFHAIENDIEPLEAAGVRPPTVADTAVAAAMLGLPTGLGSLLEEVLDVELTADKSRLQRADWSKRPLSQEMIDYAAEDVVHLPALWAELDRRLVEAGRAEWYVQELDATLEAAREDRRAWYRTKGAGGLDPRERAILRHLWEEREAIAREHDIAPGLLLRDGTLIELAEDPAEDPDDLTRRSKRALDTTRPHADRLYTAQQRGVDAPAEESPNGRSWDAGDRAAHDAMRKARSRRAKELGLDPGVLCPSRLLSAAVAADPERPEELAAAAGFRPWQAELLADLLWEAYSDAREKAAADDRREETA